MEISSSPNFKATEQQYRNAVKYLRHERRRVCRNEGIKHFSSTRKATKLKEDGIKIFDIDKLEGIQWNIDVFKNLTMREIMFLAYRIMNIAVRRGCTNMCKHCFLNARPAQKDELSEMPFEDFNKIMDGFWTINKRINMILRNRPKPQLIGYSGKAFLSNNNPAMVAFFYDSDGMETTATDVNGEVHLYPELAKMEREKLGLPVIFDTNLFDHSNTVLKSRAEEYAQYFSTWDAFHVFGQINLSINPFNPRYLQAYKLGYRPGKPNDLTNPNIQNGKYLYDNYINNVANMITTLGISSNVQLLFRYSTENEKNMDGMYFKDLEQILRDVEKRCAEIFKEKYPEKEAIDKATTIKYKIKESIESDGGRTRQSPICIKHGRYKKLFYSRNPQEPRNENTNEISSIDINALSPVEYERFVNNYWVIIDTNGKIYYRNKDEYLIDSGKELCISTNGKKTMPFNNLIKQKVKN